MSIYTNGIARMRVVESNPLHVRWETKDVIQEEKLILGTYTVVSDDPAGTAMRCGCEAVVCVRTTPHPPMPFACLSTLECMQIIGCHPTTLAPIPGPYQRITPHTNMRTPPRTPHPS